jgi:hypothetical protein
MITKLQYHVIVVVDIEGFGSRSNPVQLWLRGHLYRVLQEAFEAAGVALDEAPPPQDRGDGAFWLLHGSVPKEDLTDLFINRLHAGLRMYAMVAGEAAGMRLRVALHAGEVGWDGRGWVGKDLNTACRIVDSDALRKALAAAAPRAALALAVSRQWYDSVVRDEPGAIDRSTYRPVRFKIKELDDVIWIRVPGFDSPPGLDEYPQGLASRKPRAHRTEPAAGDQSEATEPSAGKPTEAAAADDAPQSAGTTVNLSRNSGTINAPFLAALIKTNHLVTGDQYRTTTPEGEE